MSGEIQEQTATLFTIDYGQKDPMHHEMEYPKQVSEMIDFAKKCKALVEGRGVAGTQAGIDPDGGDLISRSVDYLPATLMFYRDDEKVAEIATQHLSELEKVRDSVRDWVDNTVDSYGLSARLQELNIKGKLTLRDS